MPRPSPAFALLLGLALASAAAAAQIKGAFREGDFEAGRPPQFAVLGKADGYRCVLKEAVGYVVCNGAPEIDYDKSAFVVCSTFTEHPRPPGKEDAPWREVDFDADRPDFEWKLEPVPGPNPKNRRGDEMTVFRAVLKKGEKGSHPDTAADRTPGPGGKPKRVAVGFRLRFKGDDFPYRVGDKVVELK